MFESVLGNVVGRREVVKGWSRFLRKGCRFSVRLVFAGGEVCDLEFWK